MKKLHVKNSKINGEGLYTQTIMHKNELVSVVKGPLVRIKNFDPEISQKGVNWIGVSKEIWINTDKSMFKYINHSCDPNCAFITPRKIYTLRDIPAHTELTIDYSLNEAEFDWKIENCMCGSSSCRKVITPIQLLNKEIFKNKEKIIQTKFKKIYRSYLSSVNK